MPFFVLQLQQNLICGFDMFWEMLKPSSNLSKMMVWHPIPRASVLLQHSFWKESCHNTQKENGPALLSINRGLICREMIGFIFLKISLWIISFSLQCADILICHSFVMYGQLSLSSIDEMPVQSLVKTRHETQTCQEFSALSLSLNRKVLIRESNLFFLLLVTLCARLKTAAQNNLFGTFTWNLKENNPSINIRTFWFVLYFYFR